MAEKRTTQVEDTLSAELESLSPELRNRIDALGQRLDQVDAADSTQIQGIQRLSVQTLEATSSSPTSGDDILVGTQGDDEISALAGNDTVVSLAGNDRVFGGPGNDDIIAGGDDDFVDGGTGNDLIFGDSDLDQDPTFSVSGDDTLNGGAGIDTIFGGAGNDILNGGTGADNLFGQEGNDSLNGNDGADNLNGGNGDDILNGGAGNDRFFAGAGNDQLFGEGGNDQLNADAGDDIVDGGAGNDLVFGGTGNDSLAGGNGADEIVGGAGDDSLSGGNGNDRLTGVDPFVAAFGFGNGERDNLTGGGGSDTFVLGAGTEVFYDNQGNNDFALINDFNLSQDFIELPANPQVTNNVAESGDAGQSLADAQIIPSGTAALDSISGTISDVNDVDLYRINLTGGGTFSATTVGGTNIDSQLFLFDENGIGVLANDQASNSNQSTISADSLNPGTYFLAISSFNNDPVSTGGLIFPDFPFDQILGPTEVGGRSPLSGFTGGFGGTGDYEIALNGVSAAPANAGVFSLGATPAGVPSGTAISFENDLIGVISGIAPSQLSLDSGNFVFV